MFRRLLLSTSLVALGLLTSASVAMAAPLANHADYLIEDFDLAVHYQGSMDNPVREFGESLISALNEAGILEGAESDVALLIENHLLRQDLLIGMNTSEELAYLAVPLRERGFKLFKEAMEERERIAVSSYNGSRLYSSYKGNRFAFIYWNGALFLAQSESDLRRVLNDLPMDEHSWHEIFEGMPREGFLSMVNTGSLSFAEQEVTAEFSTLYDQLMELNDYSWSSVVDLGDDHYGIQQYNSWNDELLQAADFSFGEFNFEPSLYKIMPSEDTIFYFETSDLYNYVMGVADVIQLESILEEVDQEIGYTSFAEGWTSFHAEYGEYLALLNERLAVSIQWEPGVDRVPRVTLVTEAADINVETIRSLNLLIQGMIEGELCGYFCADTRIASEREGEFIMIEQDFADPSAEEEDQSYKGELYWDFTFEPYMNDYVFGRTVDGHYILSNVANADEDLEDPNNRMEDNEAFMNFFNEHSAAPHTLNQITYYDFSNVFNWFVEEFTYEEESGLEFLTEIDPWYSQMEVGHEWTSSFWDLSIPVSAAIETAVSALVDDWSYSYIYTGARWRCLCTFEDLANEDTSWYENELMVLVDEGVIDDSQSEFRPNDAMSRAEFVAMVVRHYGWEDRHPRRTGSATFSDVRASDWYNLYLGIAYEEDILKGDPGSRRARPNDPITRAEAVQILMNASGLLQVDSNLYGGFDDVPSNEWYAEAVDRAYDHGIIRGVSPNRFAPTRALTRAEAVVMMSRLGDVEIRF